MVFGNLSCNSANVFELESAFIKLIKIMVGEKGAKNPGKRENIFENIFENGNYWSKR